MAFLYTIRDPAHEEHAAMRRWRGGPFDPASFEINAANTAMCAQRL